jgi:hypothetical protein
MPEAHAVVYIPSSGFPNYLDVARTESPKWPSSSNLFSSLCEPWITITTPSRRETVFLTRSHQRIMDHALRRSLRIIA